MPKSNFMLNNLDLTKVKRVHFIGTPKNSEAVYGASRWDC